MAYIIRKTDGTTLGTILDGTIDDRFETSLQLVGRNYSNYGQIMTDNLVSLLEHFSRDVSPPNPLEGQLWWNNSDKRLRVYTGPTLGFKIIGGATSQTTAPTTTTSGDFWWDSGNKQLYVYDAATSSWILIGPERDNTGAKWEKITDTMSTDHTVLIMYISGTKTGIISNDDEFTPLNPISGYSTIKRGYNQASPGIFNGTAANSNTLGNLPATSFLRSDTNTIGIGTLTIANDEGIAIGVSSNLTFKTTSVGNSVFRNSTLSSIMEFKIATPSGDINALTLQGTTNKAFVNALSITGTVDSTSTSTGILTVSGGVGIGGAINVAGGGTFAGALFAPTAVVGTANTMVATTEFVVNNSGFLRNKIYTGTSANTSTTFIEVNSGVSSNARVIIDGVSVATASSAGLNLSSGATAVTQPDVFNGTGNARVATTQFVKTATQWWGGSKKYVSQDAPILGVNDPGSVDGDFWFQYNP